MLNRIFQITATIALLGCGLAHSSPMFALAPGLIAGQPGSTIGWGFSIHNDTLDWLLIDSSQFCQVGQDPLFSGPCTTILGSPTPATGYTDLIAINGTAIAPMSTLSTAYDPVSQLGLGTYTIDPAAPLYAVDTGNIVLTYVEFNGNPFRTGVPVSGDLELGLNDLAGGASSGAAAVEVTPEPATLLLGGLSLVGFALLRRRLLA